MISIVLDTSTSFLVVGLFKDDVKLDCYQDNGNRRQSENMLIELNDILNRNSIKLKDVNEVIITIGPGSYTGVRIALTTAKILAATLNIRVKVISSLMSLVGIKKGISIIDARSNKVFIGVYNNGDVLLEDCLIDIDQFLLIRNSYLDFDVYGDGFLVGIDSIGSDIVVNMFNLSKGVDYVDNVDGLIPVYLKEVEAKKIW